LPKVCRCANASDPRLGRYRSELYVDEPGVLLGSGLTPTGTMDIVTPSTGAGVHTTDTYDIIFLIGATQDEIPLSIPNLRVGASELFLNKDSRADRRDILRRCILIYNGAPNTFSLCF